MRYMSAALLLVQELMPIIFSKEELLESIDYAHIHNRKVYLTVNTLLKEREMEEQLFDYLLPYYEQGLDAVIVQGFWCTDVYP